MSSTQLCMFMLFYYVMNRQLCRGSCLKITYGQHDPLVYIQLSEVVSYVRFFPTTL